MMRWKTKLREEYRFRQSVAERWQSAESVLLSALRDTRRFYAELIAESVLDCIKYADDDHPTVEVDEITSEEWLAGYVFCDRAIDWICDY